jgi:hypothetical protein
MDRQVQEIDAACARHALDEATEAGEQAADDTAGRDLDDGEAHRGAPRVAARRADGDPRAARELDGEARQPERRAR